MIEVGLAVAGGTLGAGLLAVFALRLLPTVRLQIAGLALVAVCLPLAAVLVSGAVMFHMGDDVKILAVAAASASAVLVAALLLARTVSGRIDGLRSASVRLAEGDLAARAPVDGPAELAELGAAFNTMAANVEQLFDARRELVAWASHDLRTPIAAMRAMLEAIEDGLVEPEVYLGALYDQTRTLARLVDDLFELARLDSGVLTLELRAVPIGAVVESCLRGLAAEASARHVRLEARLGAPLPDVRCAPEQVERILLNLLTNALRHTPSDGSVAVVVRTETNRMLVAVEDTGVGLDESAERRAFERFWRGDASRSHAGGGGAGLGLAIARGLVEAQGGSIWAEKRPAGGARVAFTLPLATAEP